MHLAPRRSEPSVDAIFDGHERPGARAGVLPTRWAGDSGWSWGVEGDAVAEGVGQGQVVPPGLPFQADPQRVDLAVDELALQALNVGDLDPDRAARRGVTMMLAEVENTPAARPAGAPAYPHRTGAPSPP